MDGRIQVLGEVLRDTNKELIPEFTLDKVKITEESVHLNFSDDVETIFVGLGFYNYNDQELIRVVISTKEADSVTFVPMDTIILFLRTIPGIVETIKNRAEKSKEEARKSFQKQLEEL